VPGSLAAAIKQAYPPRRHPHYRFREDTVMTRNPDAEPEAPMTEPDDDSAREIINAERKAGRLLAKLGLTRRAALAHREHADAIAAGLPEEQIAAAAQHATDMTALALAAIDTDDE
jgi:hypothetical protein